MFVGPVALAQETDDALPPSSTEAADPASAHAPSSSQDMDQSSASSATETSPDAASPMTADAASIDDQKIEQFANAYMEVTNIQQKASAELQGTTDPAAADQVKTSAESEMISAVERNGLNVDEFNQIVQTMSADASVRDRVAAKLQERSGG
jgi:hypothetical protein